MKKNYLKKATSLERRINIKRIENVNLMLENAQLKDKLALYEQFFGQHDKLLVREFEFPLDEDTIEIAIRHHPDRQITQVLSLIGGTQQILSNVMFYGVMEEAKEVYKESQLMHEFDVDEFDDEEDDDMEEIF